jgi:hypothetical protein
VAVPTFNEAIAALLALTAIAVTACLAVLGNEQAAGALYAVAAAAVGYYLRGRVERPAPTVELPPAGRRVP